MIVTSASDRGRPVTGGLIPDDRYLPEQPEADAQALALATLIDAAGDDLERNGPVTRTQLRRRLVALEAEWIKPATVRISRDGECPT